MSSLLGNNFQIYSSNLFQIFGLSFFLSITLLILPSFFLNIFVIILSPPSISLSPWSLFFYFLFARNPPLLVPACTLNVTLSLGMCRLERRTYTCPIPCGQHCPVEWCQPSLVLSFGHPKILRHVHERARHGMGLVHLCLQLDTLAQRECLLVYVCPVSNTVDWYFFSLLTM